MRRRHVKGGRYQVQGTVVQEFLALAALVGWVKAHRVERGYWHGPSCAFAHAVRPRRLTAWAKSRAVSAPAISCDRRLCPPYGASMSPEHALPPAVAFGLEVDRERLHDAVVHHVGP